MKLSKKIGITGTHYSGKSTFAFELVSLFNQLHLRTDIVKEASRNSFFIVSNQFGYAAQLDILGRHITDELNVQRTNEITICDRTTLDVWAYTNFLQTKPENQNEKIYFNLIKKFNEEYIKTYDILIFKEDYFNLVNNTDPIRDEDLTLQINILKFIKNYLTKNSIEFILLNEENKETVKEELRQLTSVWQKQGGQN